MCAVSPASAQTKVSCVGDSITFGYELEDEEAYPYVLGNLLGNAFEVGNFGENGAGVLKRGDNPYWLLDVFTGSKAFDPGIVVIMLGTNDSKPENWESFEEEFEADYGDLIQEYRDLGARVFVALPPPPQDNEGYWQIDAVIAHLRNVIEATDVDVIDVNAAMRDFPQYFADDVHPTAEGAAYLAEVVFEAISGAEGGFPGTGGTAGRGGSSAQGGNDEPGAGVPGVAGFGGSSGRAGSGSGGVVGGRAGSGGISGGAGERAPTGGQAGSFAGVSGVGAAAGTTSSTGGTPSHRASVKADSGCSCRVGGQPAGVHHQHALLTLLGLGLLRRRSGSHGRVRARMKNDTSRSPYAGPASRS